MKNKMWMVVIGILVVLAGIGMYMFSNKSKGLDTMMKNEETVIENKNQDTTKTGGSMMVEATPDAMTIDKANEVMMEK